jgi:putative spermidine/putrescine transport system substrate-binding protein
VGELSVVAVVKGSPNAYWAEKYIDFILSREVQTAEAMDLVDSPVNMYVELPPEIGVKLTYGEEIIDALIFFDQAFIAQHLDEWIARWNEIRTQ